MNKQDAIDILSEVKELDDSMYQYNPAYMEALDMAITALNNTETTKSDPYIPKHTIKLSIQEKKYDPVDKPEHYAHGAIQCIDAMLDVYGKEAVQHFCLLNAFKYLWRTEHKNGVQDVKKAIWYLNHYVELENGNEN